MQESGGEHSRVANTDASNTDASNTDASITDASITGTKNTGTKNTGTDRLLLSELVLHTEIGAFSGERDAKQRLRFTMAVDLAAPGPTQSDDVDAILSYDTLRDAITDALAERRYNLLETLAEEICARILQAPGAAEVWLRIEKLDRGPAVLGIEITRRGRAQGALSSSTAPIDGLGIAYLPAALTHESPSPLHSVIRSLTARKKPVLICADAPPLPHSIPAGPARERMALLAIEQTIWHLAALAPHCTVVDSQTELEWAARNHKISLWAPARLVLGTAASVDLCDGRALCGWLARRVGASAVEVYSADGKVREEAP